MLRTYKKKSTKHLSQKAPEDALVDQKENGTSFQKLSKSTIYQGLHWRDMYGQQRKVYH